MQSLFMCFSLMSLLVAQSYPQWGSWWQQPIPHEYGGVARDPSLPVPAEDQIQQREVDREIMQNDVEDQAQQRETDYRIQQRHVDELIQERRSDDIIQQGTGVSP